MAEPLHMPVTIPDEPLSWALVARTEVQLRELLNHPPKTRKRTEVAAWTSRLKAIERWIARASETLRELQGESGQPTERRAPKATTRSRSQNAHLSTES